MMWLYPRRTSGLSPSRTPMGSFGGYNPRLDPQAGVFTRYSEYYGSVELHLREIGGPDR
jgi:hypothetical protein